MESFWTDTPFGITLLASIVLTMITSMCILARIIVGVRAGNAVDDNGMKLAAYLVSFAVMMVGVTYCAIVLYYLAGAFMGVFGVDQILGATLATPLWLVIQLMVGCVWLGAAALLFQRMFRRWL
jgi:hypothetical protein